MGKHYIEDFIRIHWSFLGTIRDKHYETRDRLIQVWKELGNQARTELRAAFWQYIQERDRAFQAFCHDMDQYRDERLIHYCLIAKDGPGSDELESINVLWREIYSKYSERLSLHHEAFMQAVQVPINSKIIEFMPDREDVEWAVDSAYHDHANELREAYFSCLDAKREAA